MSLILRSFVAKNVRPNSIIIRNLFSNSKIIIHQQEKQTIRSILMRPKSITVNNIITKRFLSSNHNHTKLWIWERALSAALLAVIPAALIYPNPILDYCLAFSLIMHTHWGFEAIVIDYIRPSLFGPVIPKIALVGIYLISMIALAGLFYLNYSDVGTATAIKMFAKM